MECRILLVEDSPTQAERLALLLEGAGYRTDLAPSAEEGLRRVEATLPDLIISDVVLPGMDGYAFCAAVKASDRTRHIPVVLLTERNTPLDILKGLERGADNFLTKPFEDASLLERVRRIVEHLDRRHGARADEQVVVRAGDRQIRISAHKEQIVELLLATFEELYQANQGLEQARRAVEDHARDLEATVRERSQQLVETERLVVIGKLLSGVAHELNNPLSVVLGQAQLLRETAQEPRLAQRAEKIVRGAERCARIVKNFLALARQRPPERQETRLNELLREALELLAYPLRVDDIEVALDLAPRLPVLWADPRQLQQVVVNLVTNAHEAMRGVPPPRRLTFTTRHDAPDMVSLTVADTGPGIAPEVRARVFEPFVTTKPAGEGTGLGLAISQGILEGHGGSIHIESPPGQGAVFRIVLPVVTAAVTPPERDSPEPGPPPGGKTILVVDDEVEVAEVLTELLAVDQHQVEVAGNGAQALERLAGRRYDLILSDLRMPVLDGPGLYRELRRRHADGLPRLIFLTGDALTPETQDFLERTGLPTLGKPFDLEGVRRVVQAVLRAPR